MKETKQQVHQVLIVDDEEMNRLLLATILERYQIKPGFAENGHEAVKEWQSGNYKAILMDINMPVMDGFEAVQQIRAQEKELKCGYTPIIAVTSFMDQEKNMLKAGFDQYIKKPFHIKDILNALSFISIPP